MIGRFQSFLTPRIGVNRWDLVADGLVLGAIGLFFAIFTSQVWNMTFSFYRSLRTVPPTCTRRHYRAPHQAKGRERNIHVPEALPG